MSGRLKAINPGSGWAMTDDQISSEISYLWGVVLLLALQSEDRVSITYVVIMVVMMLACRAYDRWKFYKEWGR